LYFRVWPAPPFEVVDLLKVDLLRFAD